MTSRLLKLTAAILTVAGIVLLALMLRNVIPVPQFIDLGIIKIHLYSLALLSAVIVCAVLVSRFVKQDKSLAHVDVWEGLLFAFGPAIVLARVYHVITDFQLYRDNLINIFAVWNGGLGFVGAVAGGIIGVYFFTRARKISFKQLLGVVVVVVPLGQAIGRLGNFFNHELYGPPTDLPWGQFIPEAFRKPGLEQYAFYQPLFLYEALANLVLFAVLYHLWKQGVRGYSLLLTYIAGYSSIRFFLDFFRLDGNSGFSGLTYTQWLILGGVLLTAAYMFIKPRVYRSRDSV